MSGDAQLAAEIAYFPASFHRMAYTISCSLCPDISRPPRETATVVRNQIIGTSATIEIHCARCAPLATARNGIEVIQLTQYMRKGGCSAVVQHHWY